MTPKERLDILLVKRGLAESRDWAQRLIRAGQVRVDGQRVDQPARRFEFDVNIVVIQPPRYVSRGGYKLQAALERFGLSPAGWTCADVGCSTGGFTDCLLQHGAARVYAVDVGSGQLHWRLRQDSRVVVMEGVNARYLNALPELVELVVADVSFISLTLILPSAFCWVKQPVVGGVVALVKPQFEAGREHVGKGGIVRDPAVHQLVLARVTDFCARLGWPAQAVIESPILGADGNKEFLAWFKPS